MRADLIRTVVEREVVDVGRTQRCLQGSEHTAQRNVHRLRFFSVDIHIELRNGGSEGTVQSCQAGLSGGVGDEFLRRILQRKVAIAAAVLDLHLKSAGRSQSIDWWWSKREQDGTLFRRELFLQVLLDRGDAFGFCIAIFPWFQDQNREPDVGATTSSEQRVAGDGQPTSDSRGLFEDLVQVLDHFIGAFFAGCVRQLNVDE